MAKKKPSTDNSTSIGRSKDEVFWSVLNAAIGLDVRQGHLKWKISDLARKAKISRPLIYYYFGKDRSNIIRFAVQLFGEELAGLSAQRMKYWEAGELELSVIRSRELCEKLPHFTAFYFTNRNLDHEVGQMLREIESRYIQKVRRYFPNAGLDEAKAIFGVFFGAVFAPGLSHQAIAEITRTVMTAYRTRSQSKSKAGAPSSR